MMQITLPPDVHVEERLGDTWRITLVFQDQDGVAEDHSGSTWRGQVKTSETSASSAATFTFGTGSAASGIVTATIAASTTAGMTVDTIYYWDIEETTSGGDVVTHLHGDVVWRQDVSRA